MRVRDPPGSFSPAPAPGDVDNVTLGEASLIEIYVCLAERGKRRTRRAGLVECDVVHTRRAPVARQSQPNPHPSPKNRSATDHDPRPDPGPGPATERLQAASGSFSDQWLGVSAWGATTSRKSKSAPTQPKAYARH